MKRKEKTSRFVQLTLMVCLIVAAVGIAAETSSQPLPPQQELATFHFSAPSLAAELVAAEPDVVAPVAIAWDADGRLFVAEITDYPSGPVSGRIRMLEDRDGDGHCEHAVVFADKIAFPNGVMLWNGGLLVTAAPDILFFKDTNGDGHADERRVVLTGFAEGNQQLRVNGLYWGLDNWIYGANGRSDGEVRWVAPVRKPVQAGNTPTHTQSSAAAISPSPGGEGRGEGGRSNATPARNTELGSSVNGQAGKPALQGAVSIRRRDFR